MAADWIKMREELHEDPAVLRMAAKLQTRPEHIVGYCHRFWGWVSRNVSLENRDKCPPGSVTGVSISSLESVLNLPGFLTLMTEVGWLHYESDGENHVLTIPKFDRHLSESAKTRALAAEKKRKQRAQNVQVLSPDIGDKCPNKSGTRGEETKGEKTYLSGDRTDRRVREDQSDHSPKFDLSGVNWEQVVLAAESAAKRVHPRTENDRRAWLRYAVMSHAMFGGEAWLVDAAEAVVHAGKTNKTPQAHFVAVLKSKAQESGTDKETFNGIAKRIEIPDAIWNSDALRNGQARKTTDDNDE